ncbi:RabGAP/TBC [Hesseltinella vesiculosa]|uniref:RabGAP/TBC n=1 Tax=Hesseltinella vesiculosa TaxID=101127 RepID=A0A1X2GQS0_9FUNG|nr:RabGAP/TBC [Hesseltinella vesiculosa]
MDPPDQQSSHSSAATSSLQPPASDSRSDHTATPSITTSLSTPPSNDYKLKYQQPNVALELDQWFSMVDRYGFFDQGLYTDDDEKKKQKEVERSAKWATMSKPLMDNGFHDFEFTHKFIRRVYKGIPDIWRRDAWYYMCSNRWKDATHDLELQAQYDTFKNTNTPSERQIDLDIPRTMHNHIMFRQRYGSGQCNLFDVLRALANYDEQVGYCQGMASVVAILLMFYENDKAFMLLVHMFRRDDLHNLFISGFPALIRAFYIQEQLLIRYAAKLARHLDHLGISTDMFATRWYITLFTGNVVNYSTLLRIWDLYFLHGFDVFYAASVALLLEIKGQLLVSDMEQAITLLGGTMAVNEDHYIYSVKKIFERSQRYLPQLKSQPIPL